MKEKDLRTKIVKKLRLYGGWWHVVHMTQYGSGGFPDIVGCYQGYFYGLEVKMPGKLHTLTKRQAYAIKSIRKAGGHATVVTSVDEAMDYVFGTPP